MVAQMGMNSMDRQRKIARRIFVDRPRNKILRTIMGMVTTSQGMHLSSIVKTFGSKVDNTCSRDL